MNNRHLKSGDRISVIDKGHMGTIIHVDSVLKCSGGMMEIMDISYLVQWDHFPMQNYWYSGKEVEGLWMKQDDSFETLQATQSENDGMIRLPEGVEFVDITIDISGVKTCDHKYIPYHGFLSSTFYEFCERCGEKKPEETK